ncbi:hypothetical protein M5K25_001751 [Dendrobium thyrsiflorum]|uniref:Uncharacterized protein n=1 Tax=Dendrobium thyrsiflorum TaxID=117978 RepID=A0ABD0W3V6_DENTH
MICHGAEKSSATWSFTWEKLGWFSWTLEGRWWKQALQRRLEPALRQGDWRRGLQSVCKSWTDSYRKFEACCEQKEVLTWRDHLTEASVGALEA